MYSLYLIGLLCLQISAIYAQVDPQEAATAACASPDSEYELNDLTGLIQTVGYPDTNYNNYEDCLWYINPPGVPADQIIHLEVDFFETEATYDRLRVYLGRGSDDANFLYTFAGSYDYGHYFPTNSLPISLDFHSDGSNTFTGFNITYFVGDPTQAQQVSSLACDDNPSGTMTNITNTFVESLNYPLNYLSGEYCLWTIIPTDAPGGLVYVTVISYDTAGDVLNIRDTDDLSVPTIGTWSGVQNQGTAMSSSTGTMTLEFTTFSSAPGFQVVYYVLDEACASSSASEVQVTQPGELVSPGYPYNIPEHVACNWILRANDDMRIALVVEDFHLNGDGINCNDEYLEVLDGEAADSPSIGRYCGNSSFNSFPSSTSALQLFWKTQELDTTGFLPTGFKLSFEPY